MLRSLLFESTERDAVYHDIIVIIVIITILITAVEAARESKSSLTNFAASLSSPGITYDAEKEERQLQDARQRELLRIEETKQKAAQLGQASARLGSLCFALLCFVFFLSWLAFFSFFYGLVASVNSLIPQIEEVKLETRTQAFAQAEICGRVVVRRVGVT